MHFFNKFLPLFFLPIGAVALLIIAGLVWKKRWPLLLALLVLYVGSIPVVGVRLIGWVESGYPALPLTELEPADAIVVLGGILGPRTEPGYAPNWLETSERFEAALVLMKAGKAGKLIFTGARMEWQGRVSTEGDELKRLAAERGIPAADILVTDYVANTADEAAVTAGLAKANGWKRVILVTTGWHMRRAAFLFTKAGVNFTPYPVDFRRDRTRKIDTLDFVPRAEAWENTETAIRETYGFWFYRMFK